MNTVKNFFRCKKILKLLFLHLTILGEVRCLFSSYLFYVWHPEKKKKVAGMSICKDLFAHGRTLRGSTKMGRV